jgi:hypothetical protein
MYVCMHACMYACIVCMYVCMHVCMLYVRMNAHSCRAPESSAPSHTLRGCRERENNVNNKNTMHECMHVSLSLSFCPSQSLSVAAESERTMSIIRTAKTFVLVSVNKKNNKILKKKLTRRTANKSRVPSHALNVFSDYRMCSLTIECVLLL